MTTYTIERLGVTYDVSPYEDDGELFAAIHSASGLERFGSDELASLFSEYVHRELAQELERIMAEEANQP